MHLTSLKLEQFRNYKNLELQFNKGSHIFVGQNGAGKTNILEAIAMLSLSKSFTGLDDRDLMLNDETFYRVTGTVQSGSNQKQALEVASQLEPRKKRAFYKQDVKTPLSQFVGLLPIVTFLPQDTELCCGPPAKRRAWLDQLLCQISPEFLGQLVQYQRLLKQRNATLKAVAKNEAPISAIEIWNIQLAEPAAYVTLKRLELLEVLKSMLPSELKALGEAGEGIDMEYKRKGTATNYEACRAEYIKLYEHWQQKDIILQTTTVGPHRHDFEVLVHGIAYSSRASRGQLRTLVLALTLLQVSHLELMRNEKPVILFDDVFSELDDHHQKSVLQAVKSNQLFITATHIPKHVESSVHIWDVASGEIQKR